MASRNWLHLLALLSSCLWLGTAQAVTLYVETLDASSNNDWINESYAEGPPNGNTPQHLYSTNEVANSPDILWATNFDTFNLPANHSITSVKVDVYCRYDSGSSNRRVELHTQGIPGTPSQQSPAWTQSDESFAWRMGNGGWDITGLHDWTEARINNLRLGVKRIGGSAGNTCRVDAIRIVVQTATVPMPLCDFDSTPRDFGDVDIDDEDASSEVFTIQNDGDGVLTGTVSFYDPSGVFECWEDGSDYEVEPGDILEIEVSFDPEVPGYYQCVLDPGSGCGAVTISGTGTGEAICDLDVDPVNLGPIEIGDSDFATVTIGNRGNLPLSGTIIFGNPSGMFHCDVAGQSFTVDPDDAFSFDVEFVPTAVGGFSCTVNAGTACGSVTISGSGTGQAICDLAADPEDLGPVEIGDEDFTTLTIGNWGNLPLSGTIVFGNPSGMFHCDVEGQSFTVAPDEEFSFDVEFEPTEAGDFSCTVDAGTACGSVTITGSGVGEAGCDLSVDLAEIGPVEIGESEFATVTIGNWGNLPLSGTIVFGNSGGMFHCDVAGQSFTVAPDEEFSFDVEFEPTEAGDFSCTVDAGTACGSVIISGSGEGVEQSPCEATLPLECGEAFIGSGANSPGNFWSHYGEDGYSDGSEIVFSIEHAGGFLGVDADCLADSMWLNLYLLGSCDPADLVGYGFAAEYELPINTMLEAGTYWLVVDGLSPEDAFRVEYFCGSNLMADAVTLDCGSVANHVADPGDNEIWWRYGNDGNGDGYPDLGGDGLEVLYGHEHPGGLLRIELDSPDTENLNLFLLGSCNPADMIESGYTAGSHETITLDELPAGVYWLAVDGLAIGNEFTLTAECSSTSVPGQLESAFELSDCYPNPFNPTTTLRWQQPRNGQVKLTVYNILGLIVGEMDLGQKPAGSNTFVWDGSSQASGTYFYRIEYNGTAMVRKALLLK